MIAGARPARWNGLIVSLHWIGAAVILGLIALGWAMIYGGLDAATTFDFFQWHKSLGFVALAVTAIRLGARFFVSSPPAPASPAWERRSAVAAQALLYVLTICAIASGWVLVSASPLPIPTLFFGLFVIPNIAPADPATFDAAVFAHKVAAWTIAALVTIHVAGALKHRFVNKDDVLRRISPHWPRLGARRR